MTQQPVLEWEEPTRVIARRVRNLREGRKWSGERLAKEMTKVGVPWDRNIVANLETGRRASVSVVELLALAFVLDVAPVHLLVPTSANGPWYAFTPDQVAPAPVVREWIRGRYWLPRPGDSRDVVQGYRGDRTYFTQVPDEEWQPPAALSDEERERRRAERLARLRELEKAGIVKITVVHEGD